VVLMMMPCSPARQLHQVESSMTAYYTSSQDALARDRARFLRSHVNDLDALLEFVVDGHVVTVTVFNRGYREFAAVGASARSMALSFIR
jgi:hypothetical protein